jgi:Fe-S-cluster containining protein
MMINSGSWPGSTFDFIEHPAVSSDWPWDWGDFSDRLELQGPLSHCARVERPLTLLEVYVRLARSFDGDGTSTNNAGPIMPLWRRPDGRWLFWCPVLTREGRCGDHAHRPGLCRTYEPMSDGLCVLASQKLDYWALKTKA